MPSDYPDWTDLIHIIGTDIMVAIDVQGAYIMMPVDIQAQYLTLDIDIKAASVEKVNVDLVAQTVGNIEIDIVAQTIGNLDINIAEAVTLNVDITAQTIGNLVIDIEAQSVGVYLKADWEVLQGTDKNVTGYADIASGVFGYPLDYTVPDGKTFYICQWGFHCYADASIVGRLNYEEDSTLYSLAIGGGKAGFAQSFTKPIAVVAPHHIKPSIVQYSDGEVNCGVSVGGYEI